MFCLLAQRGRMVLFVLFAVQLAAPAQAREGWFGSDQPGKTGIFYGEIPPTGEPANDEMIHISLNCNKSRDAIYVLLSESSKQLKPNKSVRVTISAAGVSSSAMGKTLPNELAGIPSLEILLPLDAAVLRAMLNASSLTIRVDTWKSTTTLQGIAGRLKALLKACSK